MSQLVIYKSSPPIYPSIPSSYFWFSLFLLSLSPLHLPLYSLLSYLPLSLSVSYTHSAFVCNDSFFSQNINNRINYIYTTMNSVNTYLYFSLLSFLNRNTSFKSKSKRCHLDDAIKYTI